MSVELNHTIVAAHDKKASAQFIADLLGLEAGPPYGPFLPVETHNGVTLDYLETDAPDISPQHYAFLVSEADFDAIFARIKAAGLTYWADPYHRLPGEINHNDSGRGTYFDDPNGHRMEILTRPYGSGAPGT
ncbi:VOC family protein [Streptomyces sp. NPDC005181]|uniref:VOC family protein n=1 Tax=Streptomyces sp. NPDC005181 TaxID=3156869 RepID=UPI0033A1E492